jgi:hypothetical protein
VELSECGHQRAVQGGEAALTLVGVKTQTWVAVLAVVPQNAENLSCELNEEATQSILKALS